MTITLYIATSLDGCIATNEGDIKWLEKYSENKEDYGYKEFYKDIQIIMMGINTYKQIKTMSNWPYTDKKCYVFSTQDEGTNGEVTFLRGNVKEAMKKIPPYQNIWLVGGADLIKRFQDEHLIDTYIITIMPELLGMGIPLFLPTTKEQLKLKKTKSYPNSAVQHAYEKNTP